MFSLISLSFFVVTIVTTDGVYFLCGFGWFVIFEGWLGDGDSGSGNSGEDGSSNGNDNVKYVV
jgi:hypothetical protein